MYHIALCDDENILIEELKKYLQRYADESKTEFIYHIFHDRVQFSDVCISMV